MLSLRNITLAYSNKTLLQKSSVNLYEKQKIGLIGNNGCGKTSLFNLILGKLTAEEGDYELNQQLRISHLSQQLPESNDKALDFVLAGDNNYIAVITRLKKAEQEGLDAEIIACHDQLAQTSGYGKPALAASIMHGLGFSVQDQNKPVNGFSGGWRMRLSLARCLMKPADLILLDEPTNHLDIEAIFWLEKWLKLSPASILLISHDRDFLDACVTHILHIENQQLYLYSGNYSRFERTRAEKLALQQQLYEKQQQKISHMMDFVNRFKAKASKAKQARSRLNAIANMEIIAQAQADSPFCFNFLPSERVNNPLLCCEQLTLGYDTSIPIIKKCNFVLSGGDRVALLGPNGQGKSTFIKSLTGLLAPLAGKITYAANLKIGYFAQHQLEELDDSLSPLSTLQSISPDAREQTIRDFLGGFDFLGNMAVNPINHFSGGEKARLALAKLVWQKPNLLLLDEPTNHLDLGMRSAIEIALQTYEGALIIISHDRHLLKTTVNDFYLLHNQHLAPFAGDLEDYHNWLLSKEYIAKDEETNSEVNNYRERKTVLNRIKKLENLIDSRSNQLKDLELQLSDGKFYVKGQEQQLISLQNQQKKLVEELQLIENEWLELCDLLDS